MDPATVTAPTILIVGGVAGGASAAARARRMNEQARIVILEKDAYVSFANCGLPYYLGGEIDRSRPAPHRQAGALRAALPHRGPHAPRGRLPSTALPAPSACTTSSRALLRGALRQAHPGPGRQPARAVHPGHRAARRLHAAHPRRCRPHRGGPAAARGEPSSWAAGYVGPGDGRAVPPPRTRGGARRDAGAGHAAAGRRDGRAAASPARAPRPARWSWVAAWPPSRSEMGLVAGVHLADGTHLPADLVLLGVGVRPNVGLAQDAGLAHRGERRHRARMRGCARPTRTSTPWVTPPSTPSG